VNAVPEPHYPVRDAVHGRLLRALAGRSPNGEWLAQILASWCGGLGALPDHLGLEPSAFRALLEQFFPDADIEGKAPSGRPADLSRMLERQDLIDYLLQRAAQPDSPESAWIAGILVAGCLGEDHLWQDLGLGSRKDLTDLIAYNFPAVAAANAHDMKWKKFLYKQLCEAEGIYVCRAPSCDVCIDYPTCFGPEE
jgi:nitrogen fixation protein NifQ